MGSYRKIKRWLFVFILSAVLLLSGCSLELPTPESLITAPKSNQELMQQKQMISQFLDREERMVVPEGTVIGSSYQYINLDDDAEKEIIVFYANEESDFMLGFMILDQKDGEWCMQHKITAYGTDIHYFSVRDLDGDNVPEFLLGVKTGYGSLKELYIYHQTENGLMENSNANRIPYDQFVLAEPMDGRTLLVTACTDTTILTGSSNIIIYEYTNQMLETIYNETFDGYCADLRFARVHESAEGVYMAMRYNHYMNILLLCQQEDSYEVVLSHLMPYEYDGMDGIVLFGDSNNDGILELNSLWSPENNLSGRSYRDYVHVWLQWDGESSLYAVNAILENRTDGYRFILPLAWIDSMYYDFYTDGEIAWTEFYYENEERSFETIFALAAVDRLVWQTMADNAPDSMIVLGNHPTLNKVYVANIKTDAFNGFQVDAETLISCLQIEGGE